MDNPALHWLDGPLDSEPRQPINHVIHWSNRFNQLPFDDIDTRIFAGVCTDWLNRLTMLRCAYPPDLFNPSEATLPSVDNIELFTQRLMALQRHDTAPAMKTGSWAIPRDPPCPRMHAWSSSISDLYRDRLAMLDPSGLPDCGTPWRLRQNAEPGAALRKLPQA